ncbi:hypothetical protein [Paenibacillus humicus]|nr:hypothetical protein [Paenibacillus humicus]
MNEEQSKASVDPELAPNLYGTPKYCIPVATTASAVEAFAFPFAAAA